VSCLVFDKCENDLFSRRIFKNERLVISSDSKAETPGSGCSKPDEANPG